MHLIDLFQNDRNWQQIKSFVYELVDKEHVSGLAQNSALVNRLERRLAERFNREYCITFASCTDALVGACVALQLPKHSRIAVSNYTFTASANAIARAGYTVIPSEVYNNYTINLNRCAPVDAIMAVDIFGNMSNWEQLQNCGKPTINDAAQSLESHDGHNWSASYGDISCISFSPSKTISSWGSGGALLTNNKDIADHARLFRLHGKANNNTPSMHPGLNSMISTFESACIWVGLDHSEQWQKRRAEISQHLISSSAFKNGLDELPLHTYHKLVLQSDDRDSVIDRLKKEKIRCGIHYKLTINDEPLYNTSNDFSISDRLKNISFTVPNQHTLYDDEVERIAKALQ